MLEFLQRAEDWLWNCSLFTPGADRRTHSKKGACQEQMSRDAEEPGTARPWPVGQQQTRAGFSCNCSLCSSFCFWGILLTIAVTISNREKYRNLETIQGRPGSWYFTYSCYCSRQAQDYFQRQFLTLPRDGPSVHFPHDQGVAGNLEGQPHQCSQISWAISFLFFFFWGYRSNLLRKSKYLPTRLFPKSIACPNFTKASLREIIFWRIVSMICPSYVPLDQFYPIEPSVMMGRSQYLCWPIQ